MPVGDEQDERAAPSVGEEMPCDRSLRPVRGPGLEADEESADHRKREQRQQYQELLQELRLVLPGVQVLAGFLFTVPFSARFAHVDDLGRIMFGIAMVAAAGAATVFMTPAAFHRVGDRRNRVARLRNGVRLLVLGLVGMAIAICSAMFVVLRLIFGTLTASLITALLAGTMVALWAALPRRHAGPPRARRLPPAGAGRGDEGDAPPRARRCRRVGYIGATRRRRT